MTKTYYREILELALAQAKAELEASGGEIPMHAAVYNQLLDIKEKVVGQKLVFTREQAEKMYSLGALAAKNYEDAGDYQSRLFDIVWGIRYYPTMEEG